MFKKKPATAPETAGVRMPAVAGRFYSSDPERLRREVTGFLGAASGAEEIPKAIIAPHAGYMAFRAGGRVRLRSGWREDGHIQAGCAVGAFAFRAIPGSRPAARGSSVAIGTGPGGSGGS